MLISARDEEECLVSLQNDDYVAEQELSAITDVYKVYQNAFLRYRKVQNLLEDAEGRALSLPRSYKESEEQQ